MHHIFYNCPSRCALAADRQPRDADQGADVFRDVATETKMQRVRDLRELSAARIILWTWRWTMTQLRLKHELVRVHNVALQL